MHTHLHMLDKHRSSVPSVHQSVSGGKASRVHYVSCLLPLVLFLLKVCLSGVWLCY